MTSTTQYQLSALRGGSTARARLSLWRHNSVAPTISSLFKSDPKH